MSKQSKKLQKRLSWIDGRIAEIQRVQSDKIHFTAVENHKEVSKLYKERAEIKGVLEFLKASS